MYTATSFASRFRASHSKLRNVSARDSSRVFTDAEWDSAISRAASVATVDEAVTDAAASDVAEAVPEGKVFSDSMWSQAMKSAPLLLKELERVEELAATDSAPASSDPTPETQGSAEGGAVFTPEQWDAAIQIAIATEKATEQKAAIDASIEEMKMEAKALEPVIEQPSGPTLGEALAFSGPAPELINGRVAMLGFVAAAMSEMSTGKPLAEQFATQVYPEVVLMVVLSIASLIPMLKGTEDKEAGPFNADAERLNGRAAMVGIAALLLLEAVREGAPLF